MQAPSRGQPIKPPALPESTLGFHPSVPRTPPRVASFMSAGVDALATLRCNRLDYPLNHPASVRATASSWGFINQDSGPRSNSGMRS